MKDAKTVLAVKNLTKIYEQDANKVVVLDHVNKSKGDLNGWV
ncbi:hypothetical protein ACFSTH_01475 [Paenibacillus yanchengensis]|uniref:ABC transporter ATP-binding protein n=1 Tax=Paenibacillus yanchengensis TaxID=2035833 RepID=A0ABW4YQS3_9BACL